jgi:zinc D-Ala-D-Ala carboxypeptidase
MQNLVISCLCFGFFAILPPQPMPKTPMPPAWITRDYLMGKFQPTTHPDFVLLARTYTDGQQQYYLRREVADAFRQMYEAAAKSGVTLRIISATRPFEHQKRIWEAKWNGATLVGGKNLAKTLPDPTRRAKKILTYSSMPGTSRHHWGTDFDLNSLEPAYFKRGEGKKIYDWLTAHAAEFGFCQPYTAHRATGYNEEKWHWSYSPTAQQLTEAYPQLLHNEDISGFLGAETAVNIDMVNNYVLAVGCR